MGGFRSSTGIVAAGVLGCSTFGVSSATGSLVVDEKVGKVTGLAVVGETSGVGGVVGEVLTSGAVTEGGGT